MRNLKKVLALVLAVVMLVGVMAMGAGATAYKDDASIGAQYETAVEVMTKLGVFQGTSGVFNPQKGLTRAEATKVITYLLMGKTNADKLSTGEKPFADVEISHWAAPSIAYCKSLGIISGAAGNYDPSGELQGFAFAKMLLCALGYNADTEGYKGDNWTSAVNRDAIVFGLLNGMTIDLNENVTREQAAQMAFNALWMQTVKYVGGTNVTLPDGTTMTSGGTRTNQGTLQAIYYPLLTSTTTDAAANEPGYTVWKYNNVAFYTATKAPTFVLENADLDATTAILNGLKAQLVGYTVDAGVKPVVDGKAAGSAIAQNVEAIAALTNKGIKVELWTNGTKINHIEVTTQQILEVATINKDIYGATIYTFTEKSGNSYTVNTVAYNYATGADNSVWTALEAMKLVVGSRVLTTVAYDGTSAYSIATVAAPVYAEGYITEISSNYGAVVLNWGATNGAAAKVGYTVNAQYGVYYLYDYAALYFDTYGNFLYMTDVFTVADATVPSVIYVTEAWTETGRNSGTYAEGILLDGSVVTVETASLATANAAYTYTVNTTTGVYTLAAAETGSVTDIGLFTPGANTNITAATKTMNSVYFADYVQVIYVKGDGSKMAVTIESGLTTLTVRKDVDSYVVSEAADGTLLITHVIMAESAPANDTTSGTGIIYVPANASFVTTKVGNDGLTALYSYNVLLAGVPTTIWTTSIYGIPAGFYSYAVDAVTGGYNLATYSASAAKLGATASAGVCVGSTYYVTFTGGTGTAGAPELNVTGAKIVDRTINGIDTAAELVAAVNAKTVTVSVVYAALTGTAVLIYVDTVA